MDEVTNYAKIKALQAEIGNKFNSIAINVMHPPSGFTAAVANGSTNDASAIQALINAYPHGTFYFPDGIYGINSTITLGNDCVIILSKRAIIRALTPFVGGALLDVGNGATSTGFYYPFSIEGGVFDTNGLCSGIRTYDTYKNINIRNVIIEQVGNGFAGLQIGITTSISTDAYVENIMVHGLNGSLSTGIIINGHDNVINHMRTMGTQIGILINSSGQYLNNCHPVCGLASFYTDYSQTVAFYIKANDVYLNSCYSDNYSIGYYLWSSASDYANRRRVVAESCYCYWYENLNVQHIVVKNNSNHYHSVFRDVGVQFPVLGDNYLLYQPTIDPRTTDTHNVIGIYTLRSDMGNVLLRLKYPLTDPAFLFAFDNVRGQILNNGSLSVANKWYPCALFYFPNGISDVSAPPIELKIKISLIKMTLNIKLGVNTFTILSSSIVTNGLTGFTAKFAVGTINTFADGKFIMLYISHNKSDYIDYLSTEFDVTNIVLPVPMIRNTFSENLTTLWKLDTVPNQVGSEFTISSPS